MSTIPTDGPTYSASFLYWLDAWFSGQGDVIASLPPEALSERARELSDAWRREVDAKRMTAPEMRALQVLMFSAPLDSAMPGGYRGQ